MTNEIQSSSKTLSLKELGIEAKKKFQVISHYESKSLNDRDLPTYRVYFVLGLNITTNNMSRNLLFEFHNCRLTHLEFNPNVPGALQVYSWCIR